MCKKSQQSLYHIFKECEKNTNKTEVNGAIKSDTKDIDFLKSVQWRRKRISEYEILMLKNNLIFILIFVLV